MRRPLLISLVFALCGLLTALGGQSKAEQIYGVSDQQFLLSWDSSDPTALLSGVAISGTQLNEDIIGLDFRPSNGVLYGLGAFSNLYTIDRSTGAATAVGGTFSTPLNGGAFGFDFNPTVDRIRVVSSVGQNMRLNPDTGAVASVDGNLAYAAGDPNVGSNPSVVHAAYTNNFAGATTTTLYVIDTLLDVLATQSPPNDGTLNTVGSLGVDITDLGGFDISGQTGVAYAAVRDVSEFRSTFWTIDLNTGAATSLGQIDGGTIITAMTVVPEPGAVALLGLGIAIVASYAVRRRG